MEFLQHLKEFIDKAYGLLTWCVHNPLVTYKISSMVIDPWKLFITGEKGVIVFFCNLLIDKNLESLKSREKQKNNHQISTPKIHYITMNRFLFTFFQTHNF